MMNNMIKAFELYDKKKDNMVWWRKYYIEVEIFDYSYA